MEEPLTLDTVIQLASKMEDLAWHNYVDSQYNRSDGNYLIYKFSEILRETAVSLKKQKENEADTDNSIKL